MADDLLQEIDSLAGWHRIFVLDRLIIVQLRVEPTAEDDVAGERAADLQFERSSPQAFRLLNMVHGTHDLPRRLLGGAHQQFWLYCVGCCRIRVRKCTVF